MILHQLPKWCSLAFNVLRNRQTKTECSWSPSSSFPFPNLYASYSLSVTLCCSAHTSSAASSSCPHPVVLTETCPLWITYCFPSSLSSDGSFYSRQPYPSGKTIRLEHSFFPIAAFRSLQTHPFPQISYLIGYLNIQLHIFSHPCFNKQSAIICPHSLGYLVLLSQTMWLFWMKSRSM